MIILAVNLGLNCYGLGWGLPDRWFPDETIVTIALRMGAQRTLVPTEEIFFRPSFYYIFLMVWFAPYIALQLLLGAPLGEWAQASQHSWHTLTETAPAFATQLYLYARLASALAGTATVYVIYRLGRRLYGPWEGLAGAALLAVSMGFVGFSHFAKYLSLLNLLTVLAVLALVTALESERPQRALRWGAGLVGLSISTQLNALTLLLPLSLALLVTLPKLRSSAAPLEETDSENRSRRGGQWWFIAGIVLWCVGGFVIGTPGMITHTSKYAELTRIIAHPGGSSIPEGVPGLLTLGYVGYVAIRAVNYGILLVVLYGIPIACLVLGGLFEAARRGMRRWSAETFLLVFVLAHLGAVVLVLFQAAVGAKYLLLTVPLMCVFGGRFLVDLLRQLRPRRWAQSVLLVLVFGYSIAYSVAADRVFASGDTRDVSTRWVQRHLPPGGSIEILTPIHYVLRRQALKDYTIYFLGMDSRQPRRASMFQAASIARYRSYYTNRTSPLRGDIVVFFLHRRFDAKKQRYIVASGVPGVKGVIHQLLRGELPYRLAQDVRPRNWMEENSWGLRYPHSWLWWPVPHPITAPRIQIYQRTNSTG